jgi:hypothetical protein
MHQWQSYSEYQAHSRLRSRHSVGWRIFWSTWWMVGSLPWIVMVWWPSPLMVLFGVLFDLLVLLGYVAAGFGWLYWKPQKVSDPPLKEAPFEPFYEQGYQEQWSQARRNTPSSPSSLYPGEQWDDEQAWAHSPEQEPPMM